MPLTKIKEIVGEENFSIERVDKMIYSYDASRIIGNPIVIVWPETEEQVKRVVKTAYEHLISVVPRGGGTGLAGGAVPKNSIVLNLSKLDKIIGFEKNIITAQAGAVVNDLNNYLCRKNKFFPVIPSSYKICTIGGVISCNSAGRRSMRYGKAINWINKLELVDGRGRCRKINNVRKFCGSEGILGVILRAELKTTNKINNTSMNIHYFDSVLGLMNTVEELKKDNKILEMELLDKNVSKELGFKKRYTLFVEYEGNYGDLKDETEIKKMKELRDKAYPILASKGYSVIEDPQFNNDNMKYMIRWLENNKIPFFGHAGIGIIHPCFKNDDKLSLFYEKVKKLKGDITGEHGIGLLKKDYISEKKKDLLKMYKKSYDPKNILNRGKVL